MEANDLWVLVKEPCTGGELVALLVFINSFKSVVLRNLKALTSLNIFAAEDASVAFLNSICITFPYSIVL